MSDIKKWATARLGGTTSKKTIPERISSLANHLTAKARESGAGADHFAAQIAHGAVFDGCPDCSG